MLLDVKASWMPLGGCRCRITREIRKETWLAGTWRSAGEPQGWRARDLSVVFISCFICFCFALLNFFLSTPAVSNAASTVPTAQPACAEKERVSDLRRMRSYVVSWVCVRVAVRDRALMAPTPGALHATDPRQEPMK